MSWLDKLPKEITAMIISYLNCEQVAELVDYGTIKKSRTYNRKLCAKELFPIMSSDYHQVKSVLDRMIKYNHHICLDDYRFMILCAIECSEFDIYEYVVGLLEKKMINYAKHLIAICCKIHTRKVNLLCMILLNDQVDIFMLIEPHLAGTAIRWPAADYFLLFKIRKYLLPKCDWTICSGIIMFTYWPEKFISSHHRLCCTYDIFY